MSRTSSKSPDRISITSPVPDISSGGGGTSRSSSVSCASGRDGVHDVNKGGGGEVGSGDGRELDRGIGGKMENDRGIGRGRGGGSGSGRGRGRGRRGRMEAVESGDEEEEVRPSWGVALPLSPTSPTFMTALNKHLPSIQTLQSIQNIQLGRLSSYLPYGNAPVVPATAVDQLDKADGDTEQSEGLEEEVEALGVVKGGMKTSLEKCRWEQIDLMDGRGVRTILLKVNPSPAAVVQLWDVTHSCSSEGEFSREIPYIDRHLSARSQSMDTSVSPGSLLTRSMELGHSPAETAVPLEILRLPQLPQIDEEKVGRLYRSKGGKQMPGLGGDCPEHVLDACLISDGMQSGGFALAILSVILRGRAAKPGDWRSGAVYLNILDASTGEMRRKSYVGDGNNGEILLSSRALVVSIGGSSPAIHLLSPITWLPIAHPIVDAVGLEPSTGLPVVALRGRMLAHVSTRNDAPHSHNNEDHYGDILTRASIHARHAAAAKNTVRARRFSSGAPDLARPARASPTDQAYQGPSVQAALLNATAGISTEVAKGVWGGLKILGSVAINTASKSGRSAVNGMLSKSAPSDNHLTSSSPTGERSDRPSEGTSPSRLGSHDSNVVDRQDVGKWVNVMDLGALTSPHNRDKSRQLSPLASFAIPVDSHSLASTVTQAKSCRVTKLSFSPLGSHLCVGLHGGRTAVVVEIRPSGQARPRRADYVVSGKKGEVWLRYELRRGATPAVISRIQWDSAGRWVALGTATTIHLFAIHPEGGKPEASNHCMSRTRNIPELQPLSVVLQPTFRLRAPKRRDWRDLENGHMKSMAGAQQATLSSSEGISFIFRRGASRQAEVTLPNGRNVNIPHGMQDILMYAPALSMLEGYRLYISPRDVLDAEPYPGSHSSTSRDADPSTRGGGGRPKLLQKAVSAMLRAPAIHIDEGVISKWQLPPVSTAPLLLLMRESPGVRVMKEGPTESPSPQRNLAAIELNTTSTAPKLLPGSIYADKAVDFANLEDPTSKMTYRRQVLVSATESEDAFDGPLSTAIQSHLDAKGAVPVLPALPNGSPHTRWIGPTNQVMNAARDMVRMSRRQSQTSEGHPGSYSYGDQLSLDEETGFLYDPGPDLEDMTNGSSAEETPDDGWEDDLAAGRLEMDEVPDSGKK